MHPSANNYFQTVKKKFPDHFRNVRVLDCGSCDINGRLKDIFQLTGRWRVAYTGMDISPANNVHVVGAIHEATYPAGFFDTIISAEMLEHDKFWKESLRHMIRMLKTGGLLVFSCARKSRAEHGTLRTSPHSSLTANVKDSSHYGAWSNYYRGLEEIDIRKAFNPAKHFIGYAFSTNENKIAKKDTKPKSDLYFWGVKHGERIKNPIN